MSQNSLFSRVVCLVFACLLVCLGLACFLCRTPDFSETENRYLASLPTLSAEGVLSGDFAEGLSAYLGDHIPLRLPLLHLRSLLAYGTGRCENNRVLFGKQGYLIKRVSVGNPLFYENLAAADALRTALSSVGVPTICLIAPCTMEVMTDNLPRFFPSPAPVSLPDGFLSPAALLRNKAATGETVYFHTDHHWTAKGAYAVYRSLGASLGYLPYAADTFAEETLSDSFLGTAAAASLFPSATPDRIIAMRYEGDDAFVVTDGMTGTQASGFYRREKLATRDQYAVYLGGNFANLQITGEGERPRLLLIKDSFANCLVPFLARHYDIDLVDLRYVRGDPADFLRTLLAKNTYDAALLLWNTETLATDTSLAPFLSEPIDLTASL